MQQHLGQEEQRV
jgi:hypothetical protein